MIRVSIGLPVYNAERFLSEALESILHQTYKDFELIIWDNASTDGTQDICKEYSAKDKRIRYFRHDTNLGAAENFNHTFKSSSGEYFKWATYDDLCDPTYIEKCVEVLDNDPSTVLCYGKTILINESGQKKSKYGDNLNLLHYKPHERLGHFVKNINLANAVFGLIRAEALRKTRLIGKYPGSDYILLIELCLQGKFYEIPEYLFFRRKHDLNSRLLSRRDKAIWYDTSQRNKLKYAKKRHVPEQIIAIRRSQLDWLEKSLCYLQIRKWVLRQMRAKAGLYKASIKRSLGFATDKGS